MSSSDVKNLRLLVKAKGHRDGDRESHTNASKNSFYSLCSFQIVLPLSIDARRVLDVAVVGSRRHEGGEQHEEDGGRPPHGRGHRHAVTAAADTRGGAHADTDAAQGEGLQWQEGVD